MTPDLPTFVAALLFGLGMAAVGGVVVWALRADTITVLREQLRDARKAEAIATDRLVHAWKEGATIPPRPTEPIPPPEPLPSALQEELDQWEDGENRAMLEARMRAGLHAGKGIAAILLELDNLHP